MRIARQSRSLTRNTFWLMVAKTIAFCGTFLLPILLVRQLSQAEFGLYKQIFLALSTMMTVLPLGFAMSAFYFLPREPYRKGQVIFNIVSFYLFVGLISGMALVVWPGLLATLFNSPELASYGRIVGLVALLWTASSFFEMVAIAHGETYFGALFVAGSHLSRAGALLAAALWVGTLHSLVYAALLHGVVQCGVLWLYLASRFPGFWRRFDWQMMRRQLAYAMPLGIAGLLWMMQTDLHQYVVSHRFGPEAYAIYTIGIFQLPILAIVRESVGSVMIARVSELRSNGEIREIMLLTARMMRKVAFLLLPMGAFLFVTRREFIEFLFTAQYLDSVPLFAINLFMIPLSIIATAYDPIARAYPEHLAFLLKVRVAMVLLLVPGLWYGTGHFGLKGAITTVVAISFVERIILGWKAGRILGVSSKDLPLLADIGKLALASLIAGGAAMAIREWAQDMGAFIILLSCAVVFGGSYLVATLLLGVPTPDERGAVRMRIGNVVRRLTGKKRSALADSPGELRP